MTVGEAQNDSGRRLGMTIGAGRERTGAGEKILRCAQNDSGRRLRVTEGSSE